MLFIRKNGPEVFDSVNVIIRECDLEIINVIKYLGLNLDSKLLWHNHFNYIVSSSQKNLNILKTSTRWGSDFKSLRYIYQGLIRPKIKFGIFLYFP